MKPTLLAATAVALYALVNVVIEQKLSKYTTSAVMLCLYSMIVLLATSRFGYLKATGAPTVFPTGLILVLVLTIGVLHFFADYCYFQAYQTGGTLMSVTTLVIMLPIFASLMKFVWTKSLPNGYQIIGYILAIVAIYLVGKGS